MTTGKRYKNRLKKNPPEIKKQKQLSNTFKSIKMNGDHDKDKSIMKLFSTLLNGI